MRIVRNAVPPPAPTPGGWPRVCGLPREAAEDTPGAEWGTYVEEGLGEARDACVEIEGGWIASLVQYAHVSADTYEVVAFTDVADLPAVLDAVLAATGLRREDLPWVSPQVP